MHRPFRGDQSPRAARAARPKRATATIVDNIRKLESQGPHLPAPPSAFRIAARSFLRLPGVDVVWLAVRESRDKTAVIRSSEGARSAAGIGLRIEPAVGIGGGLFFIGGTRAGGAHPPIGPTALNPRVTASVHQ